LDSGAVQNIGRIDILLLPVGGFYTIDAEEATKVARDLKPALIVPMHFKTDKCGLPIGNVDEFVRDKKNVRRANASELVMTKATLPEAVEIVIMKHAL